MKIFLATDHTGIEQKNNVKEFLRAQGYDVEDCGAYEYDKNDDYPDFIGKAAKRVSENKGSVGFVFGGSGQGEAIVANKYTGARCALFYAPSVPHEAVDINGAKSDDPFEIVKLTREHNHANMLSIGVRFLKQEDILKAIHVFLETPWSQDERHKRRVDKIKNLNHNK